MTWRERVVVELLLLVARIVASGAARQSGPTGPVPAARMDPSLVAEIKALATHISVHGAKADDQ